MNVYIGNLDYDTTEEELREVFAEYGQITSIKIIKDRDTFQSRGFGFVEIPNKEQAQRAIDGIHGREIGKNVVVVNEAKPKRNQSGSNGAGKHRSW